MRRPFNNPPAFRLAGEFHESGCTPNPVRYVIEPETFIGPSTWYDNPGYPKPRGKRAAVTAREARTETIEMPFGGYEDLRVRVGLVRSPDYGKFPPVTVGCSEDVYALVRQIGLEPVEVMIVVLLDTKHRVIGIHEAARGALNRAAAEPRSLLQAAVVADAHALVLVHNHPSGNPEPSPEDRLLTETFNEAARLLGFNLLDHVIVGINSYTSLADLGML